MAIPRIDPNVKYKGTSYLRELNAETLRTLEGAIVITSADSSPLAVIVSMTTYLRMQDEAQGLARRLTDTAPGEVERRILREERGVLEDSPLGPASVPGVSVGLPAKKAEGQFRCRCVHTGCRGAYFQGTTRFQNLCDGCRELGHLGDPRNCSACYEDGNPA